MKLYKVIGKDSLSKEYTLYVIADDAGQAESFAKQTWIKWEYLYRPYKIELIAETEQYTSNPNVSTLVLPVKH